MPESGVPPERFRNASVPLTGWNFRIDGYREGHGLDPQREDRALSLRTNAKAATWVLTDKITHPTFGGVPTRRAPLPVWVLDQRRELGENIARYRKEAGLSQDQLADRIGKERRSVQRYERGERDPSFSDLVLIAHGLDVALETLVKMPPAGR
jgi:ribosome-binding protein aMBF1 (putative translation factor)